MPDYCVYEYDAGEGKILSFTPCAAGYCPAPPDTTSPRSVHIHLGGGTPRYLYIYERKIVGNVTYPGQLRIGPVSGSGTSCTNLDTQSGGSLYYQTNAGKAKDDPPDVTDWMVAIERPSATDPLIYIKVLCTSTSQPPNPHNHSTPQSFEQTTGC